MTTSLPLRRSALVAAGIVLALAAGCTSAPKQEAQWVDPSIGTQSRILQGAKVLVVCDAYDVAVRQICQDQLLREVAAKGANPVTLQPGTVLLNDRELDGQLLESASALGAKAILTMTLTPATAYEGSGVSVGIGGFSFGRGGGAGVGLSAPIGGGGGSTGFAASGRVTDVRNKRLVWSATLVASPSADLNAQFGSLSRALLDNAQNVGLF
jgi:hypothetical protein